MDAPYQLPIWPQDVRGLPNALARSALFGVTRNGERAALKRQVIASLKGITIEYTGECLRQCDEDVYLQIIHLARFVELGTEIRFTAHGIIKELGWSKNNASYKRLIESIDRLKANSISITVESNQTRLNFTGSLIRSFRWMEQNCEKPLRQWEVKLEPEMIALFGPNSYSRIDWRMRLRLSPLEKWLHSFYHTHQKSFPISVELLHSLTGSEIPVAELRKFRYKLRKALETLVEIQFFTSATVDPRTDLVIVERNLVQKSITER